jgi:hypothetical protein
MALLASISWPSTAASLGWSFLVPASESDPGRIRGPASVTEVGCLLDGASAADAGCVCDPVVTVSESRPSCSESPSPASTPASWMP